MALFLSGFGVIACALSACSSSSSSSTCELYTVADTETFRETFTCEGDVLVTRKFRPSETNACAEHRVSCAPTHQVCADLLGNNEADCYDTCSSDADCGPDRFCASDLGMFSGRFVCGVSLPVGSDCTNLNGLHRCAPGLECLVCAPGTPEDGGSVDASQGATPDASSEPSSEASTPPGTPRLCSKPR
jgi:hypothetical protein